MMRLNDRKWMVFTIEEIFDISPGKRLEKRNMISGDRPFIGASDNNNGLTAFCGNINESLDKNVLGINYNGSVCEAFYHCYECIFSDDVKRLHLKHHKDNEYVLLFLGVVIKQQKVKYQYAYKFNEQRMRRQVIMLPVKEDKQPDYEFMENYVRELMKAKRKNYHEYEKARIDSMGLSTANHRGGWSEALKSREWRSFVVKDIADVFSGRDIYAQERIEGSTPLVTAVGTNNGIGYFVGNDNESRAKNSISVVRNGASVGKAFFHKYSALYGNDCRRIMLRFSDSEYVSLFITQVIAMQNKAFSYSRKLGTSRLENLRIMLPITDQGTPDYDFMELFGRAMMSNKYNQYHRFLEKVPS